MMEIRYFNVERLYLDVQTKEALLLGHTLIVKMDFKLFLILCL